MRASLHPLAITETLEAMTYYDGRRNGLGDRFYADIESAIASIEAHPLRYPFCRLDRYRKCHAENFPYKLIYENLDTGPYIVAVMHDKRHPDYWLPRV